MKRVKKGIYILLSVFLLFSSLSFCDTPLFSFAVIADTHLISEVNNAMGKFEMVFGKIKSQDVDMVFILGDIKLPEDDTAFRRVISESGIPVHIVFGNNDFHSRNRLRKIFPELAKSDYYHFVYKNNLFICLCDAINDHVGHLESEYITPGQIEYLEGLLSEYNNKVDNIFIFAHIPLSQDGKAGKMYLSTNDQHFIRELIKKYHITAMFFGHLHFQTEFKIGDTEVVVLPATFLMMPPQFLKVDVFKDRIEKGYR